MRLRAALIFSATVVLAGCTHSVSGAAEWNPARAVAGVRPGETDQVLIGATQTGDIIGVTLQIDADRSRPIAGGSASRACSALDAAGMAEFVGDDWSGFQVLLFTDGDRHDHVLAEAVAVYRDAVAAGTAFRGGVGDAQSCNGQRAVGVGGDAAWIFAVPQVTSDSVRWRKQQLGIPLTWVCHGEARLRNNTVLQAMSCGGDDAGQVTVTTLTYRMSARVWELSEG